TNRDLRVRSAEERFRPDLYYRLSRREVELPPLRARLEEIPWLVELELRALGGDAPKPSARFVEACLRREWPGHLRELRAGTRRAAAAAREGGEDVLGVDWLSERAGRSAPRHASEAPKPTSGSPSAPPPSPPNDHPLREAIVEAMAKHGGNVTAVARTLGM